MILGGFRRPRPASAGLLRSVGLRPTPAVSGGPRFRARGRFAYIVERRASTGSMVAARTDG